MKSPNQNERRSGDRNSVSPTKEPTDMHFEDIGNEYGVAEESPEQEED